jgi:molybdopterin/thiamine biosynthesis adenylyltransferase
MKHPLIIGAGGVASYLLPVLLKSFRPEQLTIIDKDVLEERNLDRQMFGAGQVGQNKAFALANRQDWDVQGYRLAINVVEDWFSDSTILPDDVDALICCADNHEARHAAIHRAKMIGVMAYIGGNEYLDSQAFAFNPSWTGTPKDPLVRYPNIATDHEGSPFRCTGEAQIASPQLAIANLACAAKLLHLMWVYERWLPENRAVLTNESINALPYELFTSLTENSVK